MRFTVSTATNVGLDGANKQSRWIGFALVMGILALLGFEPPGAVGKSSGLLKTILWVIGGLVFAMIAIMWMFFMGMMVIIWNTN